MISLDYAKTTISFFFFLEKNCPFFFFKPVLYNSFSRRPEFLCLLCIFTRIFVQLLSLRPNNSSLNNIEGVFVTMKAYVINMPFLYPLLGLWLFNFSVLLPNSVPETQRHQVIKRPRVLSYCSSIPRTVYISLQDEEPVFNIVSPVFSVSRGCWRTNTLGFCFCPYGWKLAY